MVDYIILEMANYQGWNKEELSKSVRGQGGNTSRFHYMFV